MKREERALKDFMNIVALIFSIPLLIVLGIGFLLWLMLEAIITGIEIIFYALLEFTCNIFERRK